MAQRADPKQLVSFEELFRACLYEQEALQRVLVRKASFSNEELLEEVKAVRREMEGYSARFGARRTTPSP